MTPKNAIFYLSREHIYNEVARQEAIKALEKQIPKKPLIQKFDFFDFRIVCPECEQPIARFFNKNEYRPNYCSNCGQRINWSE